MTAASHPRTGQWEAVVRRSMREPPPRYTRHTGLPPSHRWLLVYVHMRSRAPARPYVCARVSCSGFELVDDPGHVDDFHGKFYPYHAADRHRAGLHISAPKKSPELSARSFGLGRPAISIPDRSHLPRLTAHPPPPAHACHPVAPFLSRSVALSPAPTLFYSTLAK